MANNNETPIELVRRFCAVWSTVNPDEIAEFFTDDAVYHNIPMDPLTGRDAIKTFIAGFAGGAKQIDFRVINIVADGDVVLTERVDVFDLPHGKVEVHHGSWSIGQTAHGQETFDYRLHPGLAHRPPASGWAVIPAWLGCDLLRKLYKTFGMDQMAAD